MLKSGCQKPASGDASVITDLWLQLFLFPAPPPFAGYCFCSARIERGVVDRRCRSSSHPQRSGGIYAVGFIRDLKWSPLDNVPPWDPSLCFNSDRWIPFWCSPTFLSDPTRNPAFSFSFLPVGCRCPVKPCRTEHQPAPTGWSRGPHTNLILTL